MKVSLVGFMGTGKTTVGKLLARNERLTFLETDRLIEKQENKTISEIFSEYGEKYFRQLETEVLHRIINEKDDFILSTGGGIILAAENRRLLKEKTYPVLLQASPEEIYSRLKNDDQRPLLEGENPRQKIRDLLEKRKEYYLEFENRIDTEKKDPRVVARKIKKMLGDDLVGVN